MAVNAGSYRRWGTIYEVAEASTADGLTLTETVVWRGWGRLDTEGNVTFDAAAAGSGDRVRRQPTIAWRMRNYGTIAARLKDNRRRFRLLVDGAGYDVLHQSESNWQARELKLLLKRRDF